ncbi:MAG: AMP-binding protein, partial [Phycisphaerae bacterium]
MIRKNPSEPQRLADRLAGHHVLVTGSTGFLAKAVVEKLLRAVQTVGGIYLLVRVRSDGTTPQQRAQREVFSSRAYDRLRASLGERFARLCEEKIHVVGGDLTKERLGIPPEEYSALAGRVTLIINSAATVTFDERIDLALDLNTLGPRRLLQFARDCGSVPFMQVSTCYVCGTRSGVVPEDFSAPQTAQERLPRREGSDAYDLDGVVESAQAEAAELRHRFGADTEACRRELIEAGMRRARSYGWHDTYTFTKWLGEQFLIRDRGNVPLVIFRPAIIEGSFDEPIPGWIDGLRMADPIIVAYGRGKLSQFPAISDLPIDLIPVDFVANAMLATLPVGKGWSEGLAVYHCASSERNPLLLSVLRKSLSRAFKKRPLSDDDGRPVRPRELRYVEQSAFIARWESKYRWILRLQRVYKAFGIQGRRFRKLTALGRQIEQVIYFAKIYAPYTHLACTFGDEKLRAAADRLDPQDRKAFTFDVERIDWDNYIVDRHIPGLRAFVLSPAAEPTPRILAKEEWDRDAVRTPEELLRGNNLFEVFAGAVRRYGDRPALQVLRGNRWLRYSYNEALRATGAVMQRFVDRGLTPGDRVAICGESCPEWGLVYLAIMRAGLTAVPLDPQLPPADAWSEARFAGAKLMCATRRTLAGLEAHRSESDAELVELREPFIPRPAAARDTAPEPVEVSDTAVASILFTSGTTVSPKAVQLTHRNFIANATALLKVHMVAPTDQLLSVLPMYHAFEFTGGFLAPLVCGATITYVDELKGPKIQEATQATGTTVMLVVPRLLRLFHDSIDSTVAAGGWLQRFAFRAFGFLSDATGYSLGRWLYSRVHKRFGGRLRMFVSGGSRLDPDLFKSFRQMGFEVYEGYGLTETAPVLTVNPPGRAQGGSVGPALPGVEIEIRNQNLEGVGEVWARGKSVMPGYLDNAEATGEVLVDGWFRTGDLGRRDSNGYLYLTGRSKDLIVTDAGKNVYPDEVEAKYCELPCVKEICVFGMPSERGLGDVVHAVVVVDEGASPELDRSSIEREIRLAVGSIGETLPSHERIATLHFWTRDLPRTSTLKAKRSLIRDMVQAEHAAATLSSSSEHAPRGDEVQPPPTSEDDPNEAKKLAVVRQIVANQTKCPEPSVRPTAHLLLDLGIDSIGKLDLIGAVEARFNMEIDEATAAAITRVSDVLKVIGDRRPRESARAAPQPRPPRMTAESADASLNGAPSPAVVPLRWLVRGGLGALMSSYIRVHALGRENIPPAGAFLLAPNHSSHLDSPSVLMAVGSRRRVWVAGAEDYFFNTRIRRLVFGQCLDAIPFDRRADGVLGLRRCSQALNRGDGLLIFPEGTRSTTGEMQPFKIGVAVLAMERKVPIVPVYIHRAFELLPKGQRFA